MKDDQGGKSVGPSVYTSHLLGKLSQGATPGANWRDMIDYVSQHVGTTGGKRRHSC